MKMNIRYQKFRRFMPFTLTLLLVGLLLIPCSGFASEKIVISTLFPANMNDNEVYPALMFFKKSLTEKTGDYYDVEIFPGSQLGTEVEVTRECQEGITVQMALDSSGAISSFYKKYQAIVAPYLFSDRLTAWKFFDSDFFAAFMSELPSVGLRYLGTLDDGGGLVVLTNSLRPVNTPEDFKGMRVRTEENPAHMAIMTAMGASAVPMSWEQVATSLATKTAHAQFNASSLITWAKMWEFQEYVTYLNHIYNTNTWVVSDKWFKKQSPEHQQAIIQSARAAVLYSRGIAAHLCALAEEEATRHGMKFNHITPENMAKFKELAKAGYRKWAVEDFGLKPELLDSIEAEIASIQNVELGSKLMERYGK